MPEKTSDFEKLFDGRQDTMPPVAERNERNGERRTEKERGPGKRSNPEYKQFSVLLKKETQMEVSHALDRAGREMDVSDLVQSLLEQWLKRQQRKAG